MLSGSTSFDCSAPYFLGFPGMNGLSPDASSIPSSPDVASATGMFSSTPDSSMRAPRSDFALSIEHLTGGVPSKADASLA